MFVFFIEGNCFVEAVVDLWKNVIIRNDSGKAADRAIRKMNATDYLMLFL